MFHIHKFRIVLVDHLQYTGSKKPVTDVSMVCNCGKPKFKRIEGIFTADQLRGRR